MNHPHPDELLLFASGELLEPRMTELVSHVTACAPCRQELAQLDQSLVALGGGGGEGEPRRVGRIARSAVWGGVAVAAAAALAVVFMRQSNESEPARAGWTPTTTWSATAGYVAGGKAVVDIDAQLTRLEQEPYYARP
jgi:anti-sigma factor RsiW